MFKFLEKLADWFFELLVEWDLGIPREIQREGIRITKEELERIPVNYDELYRRFEEELNK